MISEGTMALTILLGCGGDYEPVSVPDPIPSGPNLTTPSPASVEPYQVVFPKRLSWSPDGGVAHYQLLYQNKKGTPKEGWSVVGFFVDVSSGKKIATYRWEQKGFICPSLKPTWKAAKNRAWGEKILEDHGFVPAAKKTTRHPDRKMGINLKLKGDKTKVGYVSSWKTRSHFGWTWYAYKRSVTAGTKLGAEVALELRQRGKKLRVLHVHRPLLDYHYALTHRHLWQQSRDQSGCVEEDCRDDYKKKQMRKRDEYAFKGEVWTWWNQKGDALMAFWDDRQARGVGTDKAHGVFRSVVTVHTVDPRRASPIVAKIRAAAAPKPAPMAMEPAAKPAMGMDAMKAPAMKASAEPAKMDAPKKRKAEKKKGCGCDMASAGEGLFTLALSLLVLLFVRRRFTGSASESGRSLP